MRVIAGEFRSRALKSIPGEATRPTPDRLRETLFDILAQRIDGATFLDGYAGTGAVGIEALSRGAVSALRRPDGGDAGGDRARQARGIRGAAMSPLTCAALSGPPG